MNILTFDIEEWFHILDNASTKTTNEWSNYETRIHANMERIFSMLEKTNTKATFFCLGWIAETYPEIVKEIVARGYEVGTHSRMHQLVYEQTPAEFEKDLAYSIKTLEDITGQKVKYFRAPGFSITETEKWAFEILIKHGIEADSSVFPALRGHGGFPSYTTPTPSVILYKGKIIKELPINYIRLANQPVIYSGGGYFRLFPYHLINRWTSKQGYVMSYLHPRDFDPGQPMIKDLPRIRKFKSYNGLKKAENKFIRWITDHEFTDIATAVDNIDWEKVPLVKL
ncbi:MAG: polysaccharide deacetylase family protein [Candidatus Delongbacteria bacterium]|jgi:polysaccharide deacetylase family protein (PEP-CTERM system associated)|nr:polysaccharide deacetylase family protein [Candidatus Delongbacteria bacterium]